MTPEDRVTCTAEKKLKSMLPKIIKIGYEALNLINFFTFGPKEVRSVGIFCAVNYIFCQCVCVCVMLNSPWVAVAFVVRTGPRVDHSQEFKGARGRWHHSF